MSNTHPAKTSFTETSLAKGAYTKLESRLRRTVAAVATPLAEEKLLRSTAFLKLLNPLYNATREAMQTGKRVGMGGVPALLTPAEEARAKALFDTQSAHLRAWLLSSGPLVAHGGVGVGPRLDMYALSIFAAYQTGLAFGLLQAASNEKGMALYQGDPIWLWERSKAPGLMSCADCMAREAASLKVPYTLTQLLTIGFPSQGKTKCMTRCRCRVRLVDTFGTPELRAHAHSRKKSTSYHGVASPEALAAAHGSTVGSTPKSAPKK